MSKESECRYCKFINEDMPLEKDRGREVTEIRYSTKNYTLFYWGHHYRIPLNFCPNCGAKMDVPDINVGDKAEIPTGEEVEK